MFSSFVMFKDYPSFESPSTCPCCEEASEIEWNVQYHTCIDLATVSCDVCGVAKYDHDVIYGCDTDVSSMTGPDMKASSCLVLIPDNLVIVVASRWGGQPRKRGSITGKCKVFLLQSLDRGLSSIEPPLQWILVFPAPDVEFYLSWCHFHFKTDRWWFADVP